MNKIHRTVWSETRQAYVVVHEKAATRGKPSSTKTVVAQTVVAALMALGAGQALAVACPTVSGGLITVDSMTVDSPCVLGDTESLTISGTGSISISGDTNPILVSSGTTAAGSITNSGTVSNTGTGGSEDNVAILIRGAINQLVNDRVIESDTGSGVMIDSSGVANDIINYGTISGASAIGIFAGGTITGGITNSGTLSQMLGQSTGIYMRQSGVGGSIINQGTIAGTNAKSSGAGIALFGSSITGGITNSGTLSVISGNVPAGGTSAIGYGIYLNTASTIDASIVNQGTIKGSGASTGIGIGLYGGSSITGGITNSGTLSTISGMGLSIAYGVYLSGSTLGGSIVNQGTIAGFNTSSRALGVGIALFGSRVTGGITNSGTLSLISGSSYGVSVRSSTISGSIVNAGTIAAAAGTGVALSASSFITGGITNSGSILGDRKGILVNSSTVTGGIVNSSTGLIKAVATGSPGLSLISSSVDSIRNAGTIQGEASGVNANGSTITQGITNTGLISGNYGLFFAVSNNVTGGIVNNANGTIAGTTSGITVGFSEIDVITNNALISGGTAGIALTSSSTVGSINNAGTISAAFTNKAPAVGILLDHSTITAGVTNSGLIHAVGSDNGASGIHISTSATIAGGIHNSSTGRITAEADDARGINIDGSGAFLSGGIVNAGTISATSSIGGAAGILIANGGVLANGITNSGLITGNYGIFSGINGANLSGGITNLSGGRIFGTSGYAAALFQSSPLVINNQAGATISGVIQSFGQVVDLNNAGLWILPENPASANEYIASNLTGSFANTGTLRIGAYGTGAGEYSQIAVDGNATLGGALFVDVKTGSPLESGDSLDDVITATGGITGSFASINDNSTLFNFTGVYNANDFDLMLAPAAATGGTSTLDIVTRTGNSPARGAAVALDQIFTDTNNPITQLFIPVSTGTDQEISNAVSQTLPLLAGGSQRASLAALSGMNRIIQARQEANRGLSSGEQFYGDKKMWMKPFGSWADQNDRKAVSGYDARVAGVVFGADATLSDEARVGLAFAYANAGVDGHSSVAPNSANVDVYQLMGYGSYALDSATEVNYQVGVGQNKNDGTRRLPSFGLTAKSGYDSLLATAAIGVGRTYQQNETTSFTPSLRAEYTWIKDKGYTEKGAGAFNLDVKGRSTDQLILGIDGKLTHELKPGTTLSANLGLGYDVLNKQASITSAYAGAPGIDFTTKGLDSSPWLVRGGLGLATTMQSGVEISVRYDAEYRTDFLNQTASVKARWAF